MHLFLFQPSHIMRNEIRKCEEEKNGNQIVAFESKSRKEKFGEWIH